MVRSLLVLFATAIVLAVALAQASDFPDGVAKRYNKKEPSLFWTRQGEEYRLPKSLEPTVYSIRLLPFIEPGNFTVDGYIEIRVNCIEDTNNITMNSKDIEINDMSITVVDTETNNPIAVSGLVDNQTTVEMITIQTVGQLMAGKSYKISMSFVSSLLNDEFRGFYLSSYVENGVTKYLATTQFESTDARRAFPCWDEPDFKAQFSITLGRKESWSTDSNMPLLSTNSNQDLPGYVWDYYKTSLKMSSYLVAFLVSEFNYVTSDPSLSKMKVRVWSRPDAQNLTGYSSEVGPKIMTFFEEYFGIDYPIPKQDIAAIPDFRPGAMENWGLVTFREKYVFYDEKTTSAFDKQEIVAVTAHEFAHQWFGDLVTTDWWNTIWLNEGFAAYLEFLGTDAVEPGFRYSEQFAIVDLQDIFIADSYESSHPMQNEVNTLDEVHTVFDGITYAKGASVIRMMADFIGKDVFQRGLSRYLNENAYGNAVQDDLWKALEEEVDIEGVILPATVKEIMDTWTLKKNYPLITVIRDYGDSDGALVTQERFLMKKSEDSTDPTVYQWYVPLTHTNNFSAHSAIAWIKDTEQNRSLISLGATNDQWVIFNVEQQGYYRVTYDQENYKMIVDQLVSDHSKIALLNRAQLLDDAFTLAKIDKISYSTAFDLTLYLKNEVEYVPWRSVLDELDYIDVMLHKSQENYDWQRYMTSLVRPYYTAVGFMETESDEHLTIYSRRDATNWACRLQISDCINSALEEYRKFMAMPEDTKILSSNQRDFILRAGVENGGQAEWDFAFEQYKKASGNGDFLRAISATRRTNIIYAMLEKTLDEASGIRRDDVGTLFNYIAYYNPVGNEVAFNFLSSRWNEIQTLGDQYCVDLFNYICYRLNTEDDMTKMMELHAQHVDILGSSPYGIQVLQENIDWMSANEAEIGDWLAPTETTMVTDKTTTATIPTEPTTIPTEPTTIPTEPTTIPTEPTTIPTEPTTEASTGTAIQSSLLVMGSVLMMLLGACLFE